MNRILKRQRKQKTSLMQGKRITNLLSNSDPSFFKSRWSDKFTFWLLVILGLTVWNSSAILTTLLFEIYQRNLISWYMDDKETTRVSSNIATQLSNGHDWSAYASVSFNLQHLDYDQSKMLCLIEITIPRYIIENFLDIKTKEHVFQDWPDSLLQIISKPEYENKKLFLHLGSLQKNNGSFEQITMKQIGENYDIVYGVSRFTIEREIAVASHSRSYPFDISYFSTKISLSCPDAAFFDGEKKMASHSIPFNLFITGLADESKNTVAFSNSVIIDDLEAHLLYVKTERTWGAQSYITIVIGQIMLLIFIFISYSQLRAKLKDKGNESTYFLNLMSVTLILLSLRTVLIPVEIKTFTLIDFVFGIFFILVSAFLIIYHLWLKELELNELANSEPVVSELDIETASDAKKN